MFPIHPKTATIHQAICTSRRLAKLAEAYEHDPEVLEKIAQARTLVHAEIFDTIKQASKAGWFARLMSSSPAALAAKSTAVAAPIAGLGYLAARGISSGAREDAKQVAADIRNKVLQSALGVAGVGLGTYGLSQTLGAPSNPMDWLRPKQASHVDDSARLEEAVEKLAAVGVVEEMLDSLPTGLDEDTVKLAAELKTMNHEYGIYILDALCEK